MMKNNQKILIGIGILALIALLASLLLFVMPAGTDRTPQDTNDIYIPVRGEGVGSIGNNTDEQRFSYWISLCNGKNDEIFVSWIEPIYSNELLKKSQTKNHKVIVEKTILPNNCTKINGELIFDSKGLSKTEINSWNPYIIGFRISYEKIIQLD